MFQFHSGFLSGTQPKISTTYVVRELLGLKVSLAQGVDQERVVKVSFSQSTDMFVILLDVTFVGTELPQNMTLVQYLVHSCQFRIGKY